MIGDLLNAKHVSRASYALLEEILESITDALKEAIA